MTQMFIRRKTDFRTKPLADLPGDVTLVGDAFGEPEGAPIDFGIWEMRPSREPVEFSYAAECLAAYVIQGSLEGEMKGTTYRLDEGDFIFIAQAPDAQVKWRAPEGLFRAVFACYPHYPHLD